MKPHIGSDSSLYVASYHTKRRRLVTILTKDMNIIYLLFMSEK